MTMVCTFHGYVVKCPSVCNNTYKAFCNQLSNHCTEIPVSRDLSLFSSIINKTETKPTSTSIQQNLRLWREIFFDCWLYRLQCFIEKMCNVWREERGPPISRPTPRVPTPAFFILTFYNGTSDIFILFWFIIWNIHKYLRLPHRGGISKPDSRFLFLHKIQ